MKVCNVEGCNRPMRASGMCAMHYHRKRLHGSTDPRPKARGTMVFRFWRKVDQSGGNGCWNWTGGMHKNGYGTISDESGKTTAAHRFSYQIHKGHIPQGMLVRHSCDNPRCVNPDHLLIGSHSDNAKDMWERARASQNCPKGERHLKAKLTDDDVRAIRADATKSNHQWARELGVAANSVRKARLGITWTHVK